MYDFIISIILSNSIRFYLLTSIVTCDTCKHVLEKELQTKNNSSFLSCAA